ncbi:MAG: HD domain-containing protein [Solirubrobacteraceae bacterium]|nr:HD domain-containing protein [Solirubrobacteraceae bacterium]
MAFRADIAELAAASDSLVATRNALPEGGAGAWYVGGAVRDLLLGIPVTDVDIAVSGDSRAVARALHAGVGGDIFSLSDRFGTWRVHASAGFQIDITPMRGATIEEDLSHRDFTVNAMALSATAEDLIDPYGGEPDVARRLLRLVAERAYEDDPLRPLRLPRLAASLDFEIDPDTADATRRHAPRVTEPAAERVFAELRGLIASDGALRGMRLLDELGLTASVLPELAALKGVGQSEYHHLDAYEHTLEVLERTIELERSNYAVFGDHAAGVKALLAEELADELTLAGGLRWAALLHDIGKSETRVELPNGRVGFPGHDSRGADMVRAICKRLNTSQRFSQYVAALTRHHLRLGFLVHNRPLPRSDLYAYLTTTDPVEVEVGVLSVADRLATRGRKSDDAIGAHVELAVEVTDAALDYRNNPLPPLLRGNELAEALGIEPGPRLGALLARIAEARFVGEVTTAEEAVALARTAL